ncbi:MAG TPA: hypothetical protein VHE53_00695 [Patescibacteria group bacterium]|nr:hypothetical protein [Patescibacteria group bacterium]
MAETLTYVPEQLSAWSVEEFADNLGLLQNQGIYLPYVAKRHRLAHGHYFPGLQDEPDELRGTVEELYKQSKNPNLFVSYFDPNAAKVRDIYEGYFAQMGITGFAQIYNTQPEEEPNSKIQVIMFPGINSEWPIDTMIKIFEWADMAVKPLITIDGKEGEKMNIQINGTRDHGNIYIVETLSKSGIKEDIEEALKKTGQGAEFAIALKSQRLVEDLLAARV